MKLRGLRSGRSAVRRGLPGLVGVGVALLVVVLGAGPRPATAQPATSVAAPHAATPPPAEALTAGLARIRHAGVVRIGYRQHALPFSMTSSGGAAYGYSIDLCLAIVEGIAEATGGRPLGVEYRVVTPADRVEAIERGEIDLECGATTATAERRRRVAFSPLIFVTGARLAVPRGSSLRTRADLNGRRIAVARGTTTEQAVREHIARLRLATEVVPVRDVADAFALVAGGGADAVASDEVLLLGYLAATGERARYDLVGEWLSFEPYGVMFARDDPALAEVVRKTFDRLARTRELRWIYVRWFVRQLPSGVKLGLPMGPQLKRAFEMLGLPPD